MNFDEYITHQLYGPGMIKKPAHYRVGERRAIDEFFVGLPANVKILDVGCGTGVGIRYLKSIGFKNIWGIDLHPKKVEICKRRNLNVSCTNIEDYLGYEFYDIIWSSHSFEHTLHPTVALHSMRNALKPNGLIFMILPYPDTGPPQVHCASDEIGTRNNDNGNAVVKWFENHGMNILDKKFDDYRENEIWLKMKKA